VPLGSEHAFAGGLAYPRGGPAGPHWPWREVTPAHRAARAWGEFDRCAEIEPGVLLGPNAWCVNGRADRALIRIGARAVCRGLLRVEQFLAGKITVGADTYLGDDTLLSAAAGIEIGANVLVAHGVQIFDNDSHPLEGTQRLADFAAIRTGKPRLETAIATASIRIGDRAWIGFHAIILKGVTIGEEAIVAAGSVVTHDVPPRSVAGGNPARVIKNL
jgi:acetyltransferase-like isoleucine patch superfamily enzyme